MKFSESYEDSKNNQEPKQHSLKDRILHRDPNDDVGNVVYVVLDDCPLEVGKVGKDFRLLNSDEHYKILLNNKLNPEEYRPDIVHQV